MASIQELEQYYLPPIAGAGIPVSPTEGGDNNASATSGGAGNTPYTSQQDVSGLASRVETLEKYTADIRQNYAKLGSNVNFTNVDVTDKMNARYGSIAGWNVDAGVMSTNNLTIDSNAEQIKSNNYQAGTSGFSIQPKLIEAENLVARGVMRGATFAYDVVSAVGGQLMVSNADTLAEDMTAAYLSVMTTKGDSSFSVNDILIMRGAAPSLTGTQVEWLRVTAKSGNTYTVIRDLAGQYPHDENPKWTAGTPVAKQGSWSADSGNKYTAPTLTGLTGVSDIATFMALDASDDTKIKLTIDGTATDNLSVSMLAPKALITQDTYNQTTVHVYGTEWYSQGVTMTASFKYIYSLQLYIGKSGSPTGNFNVSLYAASGGVPTGSAIKTVSVACSSLGSSAYSEFIFNEDLDFSTQYCIVASCPNGDSSNYITWYHSNSGPYSGGGYSNSHDSGANWGALYADLDFKFIVNTLDNGGFSIDSTIIDQSAVSGLNAMAKGQSFTPASDMYITGIQGNLRGSITTKVTLRLGQDITGTVLGETNTVTYATGTQEFLFASPILLTGGQIYSFFYDSAWDSNLGNAYAGGTGYTGDPLSWGANDLSFKINGFTPLAYRNFLATQLQTAIRAVTSQLETVAWSTDHFVVTGVANDWQILIGAPSTGTDISGAGATKYLDLANGTSVDGGYGSGGWLRLFGEGTNSPYYSVFKRLSGTYSDYVETCRLGNLNGFLGYSADEFGIALGDTTNYLKYDPVNGLRLAGASTDFFSVVASDTVQDQAATLRWSGTGSYEKKKEIKYNEMSATIRVKFNLRSEVGGRNVYGRVYKNGVAVGTERTTSSTGVTNYSEDFSVTAGDLIQLYAKGTTGFSESGVDSFQICFTKSNNATDGTVNLD